jgi:hypothetical protein
VSFDKPLDDALDAHGTGAGQVAVQAGGSTAEVDVVEAGPIGIRVRGVRIHRGRGADVETEASALPERLRSLPERVTPIEVDKRLGGAVLRSEPGEMRDRKFFQVDVQGDHDTEIRRFRPVAGGGREQVDFDLTRDQLGRILDELDS